VDGARDGPPNVGFARGFDFRPADARLYPPDTFHCSTNEDHDLRSLLIEEAKN
jgi:hypothetical protein